jgi:hypothetical protein
VCGSRLTFALYQDVLVVTAPGSGAEIIPFLKTWVNLPMAIGFMVGYAKLVNILATETLFYTMCVTQTHANTTPCSLRCVCHGWASRYLRGPVDHAKNWETG